MYKMSNLKYYWNVMFLTYFCELSDNQTNRGRENAASLGGSKNAQLPMWENSAAIYKNITSKISH